MRVAFSIGARALGNVWPNPAVGCVIVNKGRTVGRGHTQRGGRPHAEVIALTQAGDAACGATAYVTLEPCAHTGKSPPCAKALINAGITRVVSAMEDPDDRVAGQGHAMLRAANIEVVTDVLGTEAHENHQGFLTRINLGRPMVTLKLALTLDGKIATQTGDSQWITGPSARQLVHIMRANHDAVMVGSNTSIRDNPDLRPRIQGIDGNKVRVVCDTQLRSDPRGNLAKTSDQAPLWLCHGPNADLKKWAKTKAQLLECPINGGHLSLPETLQVLGDQGLTRVFCEGGGTLAAALLKNDLVDRLIVMSAGCVIGADGLSGVAALGVKELAQAKRFDLMETTTLGGDIISHWTRRT